MIIHILNILTSNILVGIYLPIFPHTPVLSGFKCQGCQEELCMVFLETNNTHVNQLQFPVWFALEKSKAISVQISLDFFQCLLPFSFPAPLQFFKVNSPTPNLTAISSAACFFMCLSKTFNLVFIEIAILFPHVCFNNFYNI